jgi:hypothetical protein
MRRRSAAARQPRPPAPDDVAVPAQDRGRGHDQPHPRQPPGRQRPRENGQPRPVRPRQPGRSSRPFPQGDSELVPQHEDLGVLPPRLPPRQTQHRHDTGRDEEDQLQAHKPKIISPQQGERRPALPDAGPNHLASSGGIRPGGTGFRHLQGAEDVSDTPEIAGQPRYNQPGIRLYARSPGPGPFWLRALPPSARSSQVTSHLQSARRRNSGLTMCPQADRDR